MAALIASSSIAINATNQNSDEPVQITPTEIVAEYVEYFPTEAEEFKMTQIQNYLAELNITDTNGKTLTELTILYEIQIAKGEPGIEFEEFIEEKYEQELSIETDIKLEPEQTKIEQSSQSFDMLKTDKRSFEQKQLENEIFQKQKAEKEAVEIDNFPNIIDSIVEHTSILQEFSQEDIAKMYVEAENAGSTKQGVDDFILDMKKDNLDRVLKVLKEKTGNGPVVTEANDIAATVIEALDISKLELEDIKIIYKVALEQADVFVEQYPDIREQTYTNEEVQNINNQLIDDTLMLIDEELPGKRAKVENTQQKTKKSTNTK